VNQVQDWPMGRNLLDVSVEVGNISELDDDVNLFLYLPE